MNRIEVEIDSNTRRVVKLNTSMKKLIAKTKMCALYIAVLVLIVILVLEVTLL
jgi:hypothetical protein